MIKRLKKKHMKEEGAVAITASTGERILLVHVGVLWDALCVGIAACNIGGVTIHSFAGIGLGTESATELVKKIRKIKKAKERWVKARVLIIDEGAFFFPCIICRPDLHRAVSMLDGDLFDKLSSIANMIRNNQRPFGGLQVCEHLLPDSIVPSTDCDTYSS
jgi:ATP-dependent DNA helicase PIF1